MQPGRQRLIHPAQAAPEHGRAEFADGTLILTSAAGARVACPAPPELALFLERVARGEAVQPATFTLELPQAA